MEMREESGNKEQAFQSSVPCGSDSGTTHGHHGEQSAGLNEQNEINRKEGKEGI